MLKIIMLLCYSEYEKVFIQTIYNTSSPIQGLAANLISSHKEAHNSNQIDSHEL